jgi:CheY-like chemotaxis protein
VGGRAENSEFGSRNSEFKKEGEEVQVRWGWAARIVVGDVMNKTYLLIVEDDVDISTMLGIYFSGFGYETDVTHIGRDALQKIDQRIPDAVICDIMLPDIDGYEICRVLHTSLSTSQIPLIFLTQKDERSDKLQGWELGVSDYMTKPFSIEELKARLEKEIRWQSYFNHAHPVTNLPSGMLIEKQLQDLLDKSPEWGVLDINIMFFEAFQEIYGDNAGYDFLQFMGMLIREELSEMPGYAGEFIGHVRSTHFMVFTKSENAAQLKDRLKTRFMQESLTHYNFIDRQQGYLLRSNQDGHEEKFPFMKIAIGMVFSSERNFSNINTVVQLAASRCRDDRPVS